MNTTTPTRDSVAALNHRMDRLEKKALLSALWMFNLLNHIFRALHEMGTADFLEGALSGTYNGIELTEVMFLIGGIMIEVPIAMILMVWVLPIRANRWANVIIAPLFGLTLIGQPGDLDDYFHVGFELLALALIVWQAWTWERSGSQAEVGPYES